MELIHAGWEASPRPPTRSFRATPLAGTRCSAGTCRTSTIERHRSAGACDPPGAAATLARVPRNRTVRLAVLGSSVQRAASSGYPSSRSSALRRRIVVGVLVLLSLVLITVSFRSSALDGVQGTAAGILRPFEVAADRVARPFRDAVGWTRGLSTRSPRTQKLKPQNDDAPPAVDPRRGGGAGERAAEGCARTTTARRRSRTSTRSHAAVLTNPQNAFDQSVTIAAGSNDGVARRRRRRRTLGRRSSARSTAGRASVARVTLLTDDQSAVTAADLDAPDGGRDDQARRRRQRRARCSTACRRTRRRASATRSSPPARSARARCRRCSRAASRSGPSRASSNNDVEPLQEHPGAAARRLLVAAVGDRARARTDGLMDALKAALVLFVAALLQLSVLTEYRPFRTSSIVLVALLSIALLRGSVFGAVAGFGDRAAARHRDARHARGHVAAADGLRASGSGATARRPRATASTRRSSPSPSSPCSTPSASSCCSSCSASRRRRARRARAAARAARQPAADAAGLRARPPAVPAARARRPRPRGAAPWLAGPRRPRPLPAGRPAASRSRTG